MNLNKDKILLGVREKDRDSFSKLLDEMWKDRDSERLTGLPITLKETDDLYTTSEEFVINHDNSPKRFACKRGGTIQRFAFSFDRSVKELEFKVFTQVVNMLICRAMYENNIISTSGKELEDLKTDSNDIVITSDLFERLNTEVGLKSTQKSDKVLVVKGAKDLVVEYSWIPIFTYAPEGFTGNEYRFLLSMSELDLDSLKCELYGVEYE